MANADQSSPPKRPNLYKPNDPPLFSFSVTNPVTYFKLWFKKVWAHEGIILHLRVRPLTIIVVALLLTGTSFGFSKYFAQFLPFQLFAPKDPAPIPIPTPAPTPNPWIETAYTGSLHKTEDKTSLLLRNKQGLTSRKLEDKYYLIIPSGEAISLEIPSNIDLSSLIGKRILAFGNFNQVNKTLKVIDASDMEILPNKTIPVPISSPSPTLSPTPSIASPSPTLTPIPIP